MTADRGAEVTALRYVLSLARDDDAAMDEAIADMVQFEPGAIVRVLACTLLDCARELGRVRGGQDAAAIVEGRLLYVLDDDGTP